MTAINKSVLLCAALFALYSGVQAWKSCPAPNPNCDCSAPGSDHVKCTEINYIPSSLPNETELLDLNYNDIGPILYPEMMEPLSQLNIKYLYLSSTEIEYIYSRTFVNLTKLHILDISDNNLQEIDQTTFYGISNLWTLILANNSIDEIKKETFFSVRHLFHLELQHNRLKTIRFQFHHLKNLRTLYLDNNLLEYIDPDAFTGLTSLSRLTLYSNKLTTPYWSWFNSVIQNNGMIELDSRIDQSNLEEDDSKPNPWKCCRNILSYAMQLASPQYTYASYNDLNIKCKKPFFQGSFLSDISVRDLDIDCDIAKHDTFASSSSVTIQPTQQQETFTVNFEDLDSSYEEGLLEEEEYEMQEKQLQGDDQMQDDTLEGERYGLDEHEKITTHALDIFTSGFRLGGRLLEHSDHMFNVPNQKQKGNFFQHLTNLQMGLVLLGFALLFCMVTVCSIQVYNKRQRKKALHDFLEHLPISEEGHNENDIGTRTFRQNIKVYGSTGTVIDRNATKLEGENIEEDTFQYNEEVATNARRKPPPYSPPNTSSEDTTGEENLRTYQARMVDHDEGERQFIEYGTSPIDVQDYSEDELFNSESIRVKKRSSSDDEVLQ